MENIKKFNNEHRLTIVIPVFNEEGVIKEVINDFYNKVLLKILNSELIIAEDGSTDNTKEILKELSKKVPFTLISSPERKGYTRAFKDALKLANSELIFFSDSDGQHDPSDIFKLLKEINDNHIVSGYKINRKDPLYRIFISNLYNFLIYLLFGLKMKDIDSGFKLIKKEVVNSVLKETVILDYCIMSEFILRAYLKGYKIKEVPVSHNFRRSGMTKIFSLSKLPFIVVKIIKGILEIKLAHLK